VQRSQARVFSDPLNIRANVCGMKTFVLLMTLLSTSAFATCDVEFQKGTDSFHAGKTKVDQAFERLNAMAETEEVTPEYCTKLAEIKITLDQASNDLFQSEVAYSKAAAMCREEMKESFSAAASKNIKTLAKHVFRLTNLSSVTEDELKKCTAIGPAK
jgi:hypothetical protein